MKSDFLIAITQLASERNLPREVVMEAIEVALASAYKKENVGSGQNLAVKVNPSTGEVKTYIRKVVADPVEDPDKEMSVKEAERHKQGASPGDVIDTEVVVPQNVGRIAAQTAKQVVLQRLREAERELVFNEYVKKEGDILSGVVQRIEPRQVIIDLGRAEALLPQSEQIPSEHYRIGQRIKVYIERVEKSPKGPQIVVSRTHRNLLRRLFELEVPEIFNGVVEMKAISREPGFRSKVAVVARQEGVDAVGSCVGLRGIRIQNIVNELGGEKIDVTLWHKDTAAFIANALSPAQVLRVEISDVEKTAQVVVSDRQLSLAIGKDGQNARLAAKLTGWRIDIKGATEAEAERAQRAVVAKAAPKLAEAPETPREQVVAPVFVAPATPAPAQTEVQALEPVLAQVPSAQGLGEVAEAPRPEEPQGEEVGAGQPVSEEVVWAVPVPANAREEGAQIRFAEDILPGRAPRGKTKEGKTKREEETRVKKGKRIRWEKPEEPDEPGPDF